MSPASRPSPRPRTIRDARPSSARHCDAARSRGANNSLSRSTKTTRSDRATRCKTASVPTRTASSGTSVVVAVTSPTGRCTSADRSSARRATPGRALRSLALPHAADMTGRSSEQAWQRSGPERSASAHAPSATLASRSFLTAGADQEAGLPGPVENADRPGRGPDQLGSPRGDQTVPAGSLPSAIDDFERGPPGSLGSAVRPEGLCQTHRPPCRVGPVHRMPPGFERRLGRHEHTGHPAPPRPFNRHVPRVPARHALLAERLVVLVEDDHDAGSNEWGPHGGAGTDGNDASCRGECPVTREQCGRHARSAKAPGQALGHDMRRCDDHGTARTTPRLLPPRLETDRAPVPTAAPWTSVDPLTARSSGADACSATGSSASGACHDGTSGRCRTAVGGEACVRSGTTRPPQRHAAQWASASTSSGGPRPRTLPIGRSVTSGCGGGSTAGSSRRDGGHAGRYGPGYRPTPEPRRSLRRG